MSTVQWQAAALFALRARIPETTGCRQCGRCCGPVPFSGIEWERVPHREPSPIQAASLSCPYLEQGKCAIYEERPIVCRLFACVPEMPCPHGCRPAEMMTTAQARALVREYHERLMCADEKGS